MVYTAKEVADYIVWSAQKNNKKITNLKLQKILYFLQAYNLCSHGDRLFDDPIEKWKFGPVVPDVYHEYKNFGAKVIPGVPDIVKFDFEKGISTESYDVELSNVYKNKDESLDKAIENLLCYSGNTLVDISHHHPMWFDDKPKIDLGMRHITYNLDEIKDYFLNRKDQRIWEVK